MKANWLLFVLAGMLISFTAACAAPPLDPPPDQTAVPDSTSPQAPRPAGDDAPAAVSPEETAPAMSVPEVAPAIEEPPAEEMPAVLSQTDIEKLVLADLAARQGLAPTEAVILVSDLRSWPDQGLDCNARPGVFEKQTTPGYLIQIEAQAQTFEYHTDLHGRFILCATPSKPLDPIK